MAQGALSIHPLRLTVRSVCDSRSISNGARWHMDSPVSLKKEWVLTQQAFERLLASLDVDREQAGQKYERVRHKLIKYFEWRGAAYPDKETDETLNRVARKIEEGTKIQNLNAYLYGVARMVFAESLKVWVSEQQALNQAPVVDLSAPDYDADADDRHACLDRCLRNLPEESRDLIIEYYQDEKSRKIERRRSLAARLGIPLNALRIRAHRIRNDLEGCVRACLGQQA